MRSTWYILSALTLATLGSEVALANGGPIRFRNGTGVMGSVTPIKTTRIKLQSERVRIDVFPLYSHGKVIYKLKNLGPATTVHFGFPTMITGHKYSHDKKITWHRGFLRYRIAVDGKALRAGKYHGRVRGTRLRYLNKIKSIYPFKRLLRTFLGRLKGRLKRYWVRAQHEMIGDHVIDPVRAFAYEYRVSKIRFPAKKVRTLEIEFTTENYVFGSLKPGAFSTRKMKYPARQTVLHGLSFFTYATWPARNWAGTIDRADFRIRVLGFPWHKKSARHPGQVVEPKPTQSKGAVYSWQYRKYVPKQNLRVLVPYSFERTRGRRGWKPSKMAGLSSRLLQHHGRSVVKPAEIAGVHQAAWRGFPSSSARRTWSQTTREVVDGNLLATAWTGHLSRRHRTRRPALRVTFKKAQRIRAIGIVPARHFEDHDLKHWKNWSRPRRVTVRAGKIKRTFTLTDRHAVPFVLHENMQILRFAVPVRTRQIEVTVQKVFRGDDYFTRHAKVTISELVFFRATQAIKPIKPRQPTRPTPPISTSRR